jgi:DNA-binding beta-propeller fold protein YncE
MTNNVTVIDQTTKKIVGVIASGSSPQHVIPAYDLSRLWVVNNADNGTGGEGSVTPLDPKSADRSGPNIPVEDPYNMYFTPDGRYAIVVAERLKRLDFRDPNTMALQFSITTPCPGLNHMDFAPGGSYLIATCEDGHGLVKVDWLGRSVAGVLDLGVTALPQDVRLSPTGKVFYVADMQNNVLEIIDGDAFKVVGTVDLAPSGGFGAHGLYPSRDGRLLYVANRGSATRGIGPRHGRGSVSVVDVSTNQVVANWHIPDGGSPDMGGVTADGKELWLSGRFDNEVYVFDTVAGQLETRISVAPDGREPHGLCVWPQPGRYSLGHTGNMR